MVELVSRSRVIVVKVAEETWTTNLNMSARFGGRRCLAMIKCFKKTQERFIKYGGY